MLSDHHAEFLAARAVTGPVLKRRGYRTVTDWHELAAAGFPERQAKTLVPGLLIPRYGLDGKPSWPKFRPDPEGRNGAPAAKYATPGGGWNFLDMLPGTKLGGDVWVSAEGFIKADAMTAVGMPVVAFDGVWGWRSGGDAILGLDALAKPQRWFHIVCDSDVDTNPMVAGAMFRLAGWLRREGCRVRILHPPGLGKQGVDDFLAAGGSLAQLVEISRTETRMRAYAGRASARFFASWGAT